MKTGWLAMSVAVALGFADSSAMALEGLKQLQQAALSDQACECMIHEYCRRYNEVLRGYSAKRQPLTEDEEEHAHQEAMKWVRSVWQYADQHVVEQSINSSQFTAMTEVFRKSQHSAFPHLPVVP